MTELPKSVEVYVDECAAILSWLSPDAWLHQDAFDQKSREFHRAGHGKRTLRGFTGDTILPPMNGDLNLAILHEFQLAGMVDARKTAGGVEYRLRALEVAHLGAQNAQNGRGS